MRYEEFEPRLVMDGSTGGLVEDLENVTEQHAQAQMVDAEIAEEAAAAALAERGQAVLSTVGVPSNVQFRSTNNDFVYRPDELPQSVIDNLQRSSQQWQNDPRAQRNIPLTDTTSWWKQINYNPPEITSDGRILFDRVSSDTNTHSMLTIFNNNEHYALGGHYTRQDHHYRISFDVKHPTSERSWLYDHTWALVTQMWGPRETGETARNPPFSIYTRTTDGIPQWYVRSLGDSRRITQTGERESEHKVNVPMENIGGWNHWDIEFVPNPFGQGVTRAWLNGVNIANWVGIQNNYFSQFGNVKVGPLNPAFGLYAPLAEEGMEAEFDNVEMQSSGVFSSSISGTVSGLNNLDRNVVYATNRATGERIGVYTNRVGVYTIELPKGKYDVTVVDKTTGNATTVENVSTTTKSQLVNIRAQSGLPVTPAPPAPEPPTPEPTPTPTPTPEPPAPEPLPPGPDPVEDLPNLPIESVISTTESSPHLANNTLDGDLNTRWSAEGDGQTITYDLGDDYLVSQVGIAWYRGDIRTSTFDIEVSLDGNEWSQVYSGGSAVSSEIFNYGFDETRAQFVRIVGHGNSLNEWNSILEVEVGGPVPTTPTPEPPAPEPTPQPTPEPPTPEPTPEPPPVVADLPRLPIQSVTSSATLEPYVPSNTLDGNLATRWSAQGDGQSITYDLGQDYLVSQVGIAWFFGESRTSTFDIEVSLDGNNWSQVYSGDSVQVADVFNYGFDETRARFVRIVGYGNTVNDWNSILEVEVGGPEAPTPEPPAPEPTPEPPAPEPTPEPPTTVDVPRIPIQSVDATDTLNPYVPGNTLDGDLNTRWSAEGIGQSITYDLGANHLVSQVGIAWYFGDVRTAIFDIEVSSDGQTWNQVFSGDSNQTAEVSNYDFDETLARYVRIVGRGNTVNDWNSILEVQVGGTDAPTPNPEPPTPEPTPEPTPQPPAPEPPTTEPPVDDEPPKLPVASVTASDSLEPYLPANTLDGNFDTRWSAKGDGQSITYDLGKEHLVSEVDIAWYLGDQRVATFDIGVSLDGQTWNYVFSGESTPGDGLIDYSFEETRAQFVRVVGYGNTVNDWNSILEVEIEGTEAPTPVSAIRTFTGDVTGDGIEDLVHQLPDGTWQVTVVSSSNPDPSRVTLAATGESGAAFNVTDGYSVDSTVWTKWSTNIDWVSVHLADFTGDGKADLAGRAANGQWWIGESTGEGFVNTYWGKWTPGIDWLDTSVGDFNGDGKADIAGRAATNGAWWIATSTGGGFINQPFGRWTSSVEWESVLTGDFDGDGRTDIAGRAERDGTWWVARSTGTWFENTYWGKFTKEVNWTEFEVGDFDGDGKSDIVGRAENDGSWWAGISQGDRFQNSFYGRWLNTIDWMDITVADVDGDGRSDLVSRASSDGSWWIASSDGEKFKNQYWGKVWDPNIDWIATAVGDFDGDGKADLLGATSDEWWLTID